MYLGRLVETGDWHEIFETPRHPYTRALIAAIPDVQAPGEREREKAKGEVPSALNPPPGCHFNTRCPIREDRCLTEGPILAKVGATHHAACHRTAA
jgi:oligopeptide/dipeptide ABC transporter ATP-binding protein